MSDQPHVPGEPIAFDKRIGSALGRALAGYRDRDNRRSAEGLADAIYAMRDAWQHGYREGYAAAVRQRALLDLYERAGE